MVTFVVNVNVPVPPGGMPAPVVWPPTLPPPVAAPVVQSAGPCAPVPFTGGRNKSRQHLIGSSPVLVIVSVYWVPKPATPPFALTVAAEPLPVGAKASAATA